MNQKERGGEKARVGVLELFSFITFTTLGFTDISPISSIAKFLVILEVFIGYLMLGLLVAIISKKVIPN